MADNRILLGETCSTNEQCTRELGLKVTECSFSGKCRCVSGYSESPDLRSCSAS